MEKSPLFILGNFLDRENRGHTWLMRWLFDKFVETFADRLSQIPRISPSTQYPSDIMNFHRALQRTVPENWEWVRSGQRNVCRKFRKRGRSGISNREETEIEKWILKLDTQKIRVFSIEPCSNHTSSFPLNFYHENWRPISRCEYIGVRSLHLMSMGFKMPSTLILHWKICDSVGSLRRENPLVPDD
jgi:hypothetical protein